MNTRLILSFLLVVGVVSVMGGLSVKREEQEPTCLPDNAPCLDPEEKCCATSTCSPISVGHKYCRPNPTTVPTCLPDNSPCLDPEERCCSTSTCVPVSVGHKYCRPNQ